MICDHMVQSWSSVTKSQEGVELVCSCGFDIIYGVVAQVSMKKFKIEFV